MKKRLTLSRETLTELATADLRGVVAAAAGQVISGTRPYAQCALSLVADCRGSVIPACPAVDY
jgi:hypothetical protein